MVIVEGRVINNWFNYRRIPGRNFLPSIIDSPEEFPKEVKFANGVI